MLRIKTLQLQQFKNYHSAVMQLSGQVNCFVGRNGAGKTNVLDAVYYLSFTKSYFNAVDAQNVKHGTDFFSVQAKYDRNNLDEEALLVLYRGKKTLKLNNNEVKKFSEHIGQYPLVIITPNDIMLLHEGSEERRRFIDGIISQVDKVYLSNLLLYNRTVEQRNKQLRLFAEGNYYDNDLLESYNQLLDKHGTPLFVKREAFLKHYIPIVNGFYRLISEQQEEVDIIYQSDLLLNGFTQLLEQSALNDRSAQRTTKGVHKDELEFTINGFPLKKMGSQGQQKSFIIALKLAQYEYLKQQTTVKPLLLLDDIFEKLDEHRLKALLLMIANDDFGQILITDTHYERVQQVFSTINQVEVKYFMVDNGTINEI
ncbi:MAG: DNA replication and repair protein RecF [Bacteroidota bacterium]